MYDIKKLIRSQKSILGRMLTLQPFQSLSESTYPCFKKLYRLLDIANPEGCGIQIQR